MEKRGSLRSFYVSELKKSFNVETQLITALETFARTSSSSHLRRAFEHHLEQTKDHATRIQMILDALGEKPDETKCIGMQSLISETQRLKEDLSGAVLDSALVAYVQRIEYYEIAMYGTLRDYARTLEERDTASQLQNTLEEEQETDRELTKVGQTINADLASEESAEKKQPRLADEAETGIKPAA